MTFHNGDIFVVDEKRNYYKVPDTVETNNRFEEYLDDYGDFSFKNDPKEFPYSTDDYLVSNSAFWYIPWHNSIYYKNQKHVVNFRCTVRRYVYKKLYGVSCSLFQSGDPVMTIYETDSLGYLSQPSPSISTVCTDTNPVGKHKYCEFIRVLCASFCAIDVTLYVYVALYFTVIPCKQ